jgi:uncharacterized protein YodC (DUF2158 family)
MNVGDIVQLKSGGPKMTIEDIGNYSFDPNGPKNQAKCVWFDGNANKDSVFVLDMLKLVP